MKTRTDERRITVLFLTAQSVIYSGPVKSIALRFADGTLDVLPPRRWYFTSFRNCQIILRTSKGIMKHRVSSGTANLKKGVLKIVAEIKGEISSKVGSKPKKNHSSRSRVIHP
jgi:F0F1-type ATP synthase epsilon subunit